MKKSIIKNYIYNVTYQILVLILPLITTPYLSQVLGAENIGIYSYTLSIATYFILFGTLGIAMYAQREVAYVQENKTDRTKIFGEIVILRICTMAISALVFYMIYVNGTQYQIYYKILLFELIAVCFDISWFFQGIEEFKKTVTRNIIVKILSIISVFVFVKTREDLVKYFIIYVLSNILGNISLWFYLPKYLCKIKFKELSIKRHIKPTIALFIPQIAIQIYTVLDKTMLGLITKDMAEVGNYEQSQKIIKMALTIITSLGTVVAPRIANTIANNQKQEVEKYLEKSFKFVWFLGTPIMFGIMAISSKLVPWFLGNEFEKAIILLFLGAPLIMAIGLNNVSGMQYLIQVKKQNIFTKSVVIGAIFNFVFNLVLIYFFKATGAIIASVLAEILIFLVQLKYIKNDMSLKIVYRNNFKYLISGLIMFVSTFLVGTFMNASIVTTIIQVIIGIIVYFGGLIILKDQFIKEMLIKIKERRKVA